MERDATGISKPENKPPGRDLAAPLAVRVPRETGVVHGKRKTLRAGFATDAGWTVFGPWQRPYPLI